MPAIKQPDDTQVRFRSLTRDLNWIQKIVYEVIIVYGSKKPAHNQEIFFSFHCCYFKLNLSSLRTSFTVRMKVNGSSERKVFT